MMTSESAEVWKTYEDMLGWIDQSKTADKPDKENWRDKPKDIDEIREIPKILR